MGCGSSQQPQTVVDTVQKPEPERYSAKIRSNARVAPSPSLIRVASAAQTKSNTQSPPSDSAVASRNSSAVSNSSEKSVDSGVGDHPALELDDSKESRSNLFVSRGPSGKTRSVDEAIIIEKLRSEGIISRPKSVASGMSFEISVDETNPARRLPPRLVRLEHVQEEKKTVTEDDIKNKLAKAAERRRKKREARALSKPPRPPTRISDTPVDSAMLDVPVVRKSHPESELLIPPPTEVTADLGY